MHGVHSCMHARSTASLLLDMFTVYFRSRVVLLEANERKGDKTLRLGAFDAAYRTDRSGAVIHSAILAKRRNLCSASRADAPLRAN
eukprot:5187459-Pleurochrysis_carterae.AAC.1